MAASLISYFCTMVTVCTVLMTVMNHFSTPHMFRQPHSVIPFKHSRTAPEPSKSSDDQLVGIAQSSMRVAEAASQEPQKEKQVPNRSRRPSPKTRVGRHDSSETVAWSFVGQYRADHTTEVASNRSEAHVGQCDWCAPTARNY
jgi:hypothetical protein